MESHLQSIPDNIRKEKSQVFEMAKNAVVADSGGKQEKAVDYYKRIYDAIPKVKKEK